MPRLTILGDVDLRTGEGHTVASLLSQPRRFALLVFIALESRGGGVHRDRLLGVFWPELPQDKARQALRTALHFLRRSLGRDAIVSQGDLVALEPECVSCDAVELRAALEAGQDEEGLRLYTGDLLPGFHLDGGPGEFERWLDDARSELRRQAARAAWSLAEAQEASNPAGAGAWARRAARLSGEDEAAVRRAISLLGRIGDRAGALALYDDLARRLREEFDAAPSPETRSVIAGVRAPQAAATLPPAPVTAAAAPPPGVAPTPAPPAAGAGADPAPVPPRRQRPLRTILSGAVSLVLVAAFYSLWGLNRPDAWTMPLEPVIQVEAIRDFSADGGATDLAGALTMELTARLSDADGLLVVPADAGDSDPAASRHRPSYVIRSGILRSDSLVRVTAMLLDAASGATLERVVAQRSLTDPAGTVDALVDDLGAAVRREVGRAVADFQRRVTAREPRALDLVRTGLQELEAADSLMHAGAYDAAAHTFEAADSQLALAQEVAPDWPEPSVQRAEVALRRMWLHLLPPNRDPVLVAELLRHGTAAADAALSVARDDPGALELSGTLRYWTWLTRSAPEPEAEQVAARAERDLLRATREDAGRARAWAVLSALHELRGEFAQANLAARRAHRADPFLHDNQEILVRLFTTALEVGDTASARAWCGEMGRRLEGSWMADYCQLEQLAWRGLEPGVSPDSVRTLVEAATPEGAAAAQIRPRLELLAAVAFARTGLRNEAERVLEAATPVPGDRDAGKLHAWARLLLGQEDEAVALLAEAAGAGTRGRDALLRTRRFETLREHPGFPTVGAADRR